MKLKFLGTRGEVEESSRKHRYHSSLLITYRGFKLLIDHGLISIPLKKIKPDAIIITHVHPDHFKWLKKDEEYKGKIYVTRETKKASRFKKNFEGIHIDKWFKIGPFKILGYRVIHSLRAPAIGFKIEANKTFIYNPDLIVMKKKSVLRGIDLYIGDGSTVTANLVRRKDNKLFGHTRIQTQINWCKKYEIKNVIFTHFGKEPIRWGDKKLEKKFKQKEINVGIAYDGMRLEI
jgi:phosphoribosyl 1,2-cyclic phosphodiesterase